jgi:probable HAF family extracellular repeat protein
MLFTAPAIAAPGYTVTYLGTLGGAGDWGTAVNAGGQVAGWSNPTGSSAQHAFIYNGTSMQDLGTLGGTASQGSAINDSGFVVGWSRTAGNAAQHAFLYDGAAMHDLNDLISPADPLYDFITVYKYIVLTEARAINDDGQIVVNGGGGAFLLTPVATNTPAPASLALLGAGVFGILCMRRRTAG